MDIRKTRTKRISKQPLKDITNSTSKKRKSRRSSKNHSKGSSNGKSELGESQSVEVQKSLEFYLSLKESQLFSLFSAVKLNTENIKCRYKLIQKKLQKIQQKRVILSKIIRMTPLPDSRLAQDLSPISICDSQLSSSSLGPFLDYKLNPVIRSGNLDLERRLKSIEYETGRVIEQEFQINEHKREITKEKSKVIVSIGILYEKKMIIHQKEKNIRKLEQNNLILANKVNELKHMLEDKRIKSDSREFKKYQKTHSQVLIKSVTERVLIRKENVKELELKLDEMNLAIDKRERYLKDILEVKAKILDRVERMKEFDKGFVHTKMAAGKMLNNLAIVPRVRSSFK